MHENNIMSLVVALSLVMANNKAICPTMIRIIFKVNSVDIFFLEPSIIKMFDKVSANELYLRSEGFSTRPPVADD